MKVERAEERHMQLQINSLTEKMGALTALQAANHNQNRSDIHDLRDGQQTMLDRLTEGLKEIADTINHRMSPVEGRIHNLEIAWAKATGYVIGISAVGGVIFELARVMIEKVVR